MPTTNSKKKKKIKKKKEIAKAEKAFQGIISMVRRTARYLHREPSK